MTPLQLLASPGLWFTLLLFTVVFLPLFIGAVVLISHLTGRGRKLEELERRVEKLEAERD